MLTHWGFFIGLDLVLMIGFQVGIKSAATLPPQLGARKEPPHPDQKPSS
jgi:hypothetical protein